MKHLIYILLTLVLFTSCELETSENGKLEGFWILTQVDTLATGGTCNVQTDVNTWSFQFDLLELRNADIDFVCRFSHTADSLFISDIFYTNSDDRVTNPEILASFGIDRIPSRYHIDYLTDEHLCLSDEVLKLKLKKY